MATPIIQLAEMTPTTQERIIFNTDMRQLESYMSVVEDFQLNIPPATPVDGYKAIVGLAPTGVWAGFANYVAVHVGGSWTLIPPSTILAPQFVRATSSFRVWDGTDWVALSFGTSVEVSEFDGAPSVSPVSSIVFDNGTVTDLGGGVVRVTNSGGGGGPAVSFVPAVAAGSYGVLGNVVNTTPTTLTLNANFDVYVPIWVDTARTVDEFRIEVTTAGAGNISFALYDSTNNRIYDSGNVSVSTTGVKVMTPGAGVALVRGLYYVAVNSSISCAVRSTPAGGILNIVGANPAMGVALMYSSYLLGRTFAPFPTTRITAGLTSTTSAIPIILGRNV